MLIEIMSSIGVTGHLNVSLLCFWLMEMEGKALFSVAESANAHPHPSTKEHSKPNVNGVTEELCHPSLNFVFFFSCRPCWQLLPRALDPFANAEFCCPQLQLKTKEPPSILSLVCYHLGAR